MVNHIRVWGPIVFRVASDKDRKSLFKISRELIKIKRKHSYFTSLIYKKNSGSPADYISDEQIYLVRKKFHLIDTIHPTLCNKNLFREKLYSEFLPIAQHLGSIKNNIFYSGDEEKVIHSEQIGRASCRERV